MDASKGDNVEIVHLREGAVRIVLPSTVTEHRLPQTTPYRPQPPLSVSSPHLTATTAGTARIRGYPTGFRVASPSEQNIIVQETNIDDQDYARHEAEQLFSETKADRSQYHSRKERKKRGDREEATEATVERKEYIGIERHHDGSSRSPSNISPKRVMRLEVDDKQSEARPNYYPSQTYTDLIESTPAKKPRRILSDIYQNDNNSYNVKDTGKSDQSVPASDQKTVHLISDVSQEGTFWRQTPHHEVQTENAGSPVITLSTGVTRILVKHDLAEQTVEQSKGSTPGKRLQEISEKEHYSLSTNISERAQLGQTYINRAFDYDADYRKSSEEQHANIFFDVDVDETYDSDLQQFGKLSDCSSRKDIDKDSPVTRLAETSLNTDKNAQVQMDRFSGQYLIATVKETDEEQQVYKNIDTKEDTTAVHSLETRNNISSDQSFIKEHAHQNIISPEDKASLKKDSMSLSSETIDKTIEDADDLGRHEIEDAPGSEWRFHGQTLSKAMWKTVSPETSEVNPPFTPRTPLHRFSGFDDSQFSGSPATLPSSSEEDLTRRPRRSSFFSRFRLAKQAPRKGEKSRDVRSSSLGDLTHSESAKQIEMEAGAGHWFAERYLDATLAFADKKRSQRKTSPRSLETQTLNRELDIKEEVSRKQKQPQTKKSSTSKSTSSLSASVQSVLPKMQQMTALSDSDETKRKQTLMTTDTTRPEENVTTVAERPLYSRNVTDVLPDLALKVQSSPEATSSDSHRSVCITTDSKDESESSSSAAESVHNFYFIPDKAASTYSSGSVTTKESKLDSKISESSDRLAFSRPSLTEGSLKVESKVTKASLVIPTDSDSSPQRRITDTDAVASVRRSSLPKERRLSTQGMKMADNSRRRSSSTSSISDGVAGHHRDSDKASLSSTGFHTSESEVGPLVTFAKPWKKISGVHSLPGARQLEDLETQQEEVSAVELKRRFSADEYVPASPYATHLIRHPSNRSEGSFPLGLQGRLTHGRTSHVRQLSLDIGEEWESVKSPVPSLPPTSPYSPGPEDDSVFFGPSLERSSSSLRGEWTLLKEKVRDSEPIKQTIKKMSHQTSVKLRLLYPRPQDSGSCTLTEEEKQTILSTLTRAEFSRLQQIDSPLLHLLKRQKGPARKNAKHMKEAKTEYKQAASSQPVAKEASQQSKSLVKTGTVSQKPVLSVQPLSSVAPSQTSVPGAVRYSKGGETLLEISSDIDDVDIESLSPFKRRNLRNPFNRINQRCHSTLQCPCCFFFCFLCSLPALYFMGRSDFEFDNGSVEKARRLGRRTTILFVVGVVIAVCLLVASVVATIIFLQESLREDRGWS